MKKLLIILFTFICLSSKSQKAQVYPFWKLNVGWGCNYSFGKVDKKSEVTPNANTRVVVEPAFTANWPLNKRTTGLTLLENIFYNGQWSFFAERFNGRKSFTTGFEIGGRYFMVTEHALTNLGKVYEPAYANRIHRSYCVFSVPMLWKYYFGRKVIGAVSGGLVLNYESSTAQKNFFYEVKRANSFYPTLQVGTQLALRKFRALTLDLSYQQGFYNILKDEVSVHHVGPNYTMQTFTYKVSSSGSHFRLGLRYTFPKARGKQLPYRERYAFKEIRVVEEADSIELCFYDPFMEDGDSIAVTLNGKLIIRAIEVKNREQCVSIALDKNVSKNVIGIHAVNLGSVKPNTYSFRFNTGKYQSQEDEIQSDLKRSVYIILTPPKPVRDEPEY